MTAHDFRKIMIGGHRSGIIGAETKIPADIEHVTDLKEIGSYGVMGSPALIINGKVMAVGNMPPKQQLKELLLKAAANLAGAIEETFGIEVELMEGHNGIYQVALNGNVVYSNQRDCHGIPSVPEMLHEIGKHIPPLPGKALKTAAAFPIMK